MKKRIIIAITGASGAIYGIRLLEAFKQSKQFETHLIYSKAAQITIPTETDYSLKDIEKIADVTHKIGDIAASISSGSFKTEGMIVAPCSMKSLAEIATGLSNTLISRAADVVMKEKRKLVLMVRETPFNSIHLTHMLNLSNMGVYIAPPLPAFYNKPKNVDDIVDHSIGRVLDIFDVDNALARRWKDK
jgi:4-hydroxy-3-polyprenylbenzoate decarboxylase